MSGWGNGLQLSSKSLPQGDPEGSSPWFEIPQSTGVQPFPGTRKPGWEGDSEALLGGGRGGRGRVGFRCLSGHAAEDGGNHAVSWERGLGPVAAEGQWVPGPRLHTGASSPAGTASPHWDFLGLRSRWNLILQCHKWLLHLHVQPTVFWLSPAIFFHLWHESSYLATYDRSGIRKLGILESSWRCCSGWRWSFLEFCSRGTGPAWQRFLQRREGRKYARSRQVPPCGWALYSLPCGSSQGAQRAAVEHVRVGGEHCSVMALAMGRSHLTLLADDATRFLDGSSFKLMASHDTQISMPSLWFLIPFDTLSLLVFRTLRIRNGSSYAGSEESDIIPVSDPQFCFSSFSLFSFSSCSLPPLSLSLCLSLSCCDFYILLFNLSFPSKLKYWEPFLYTFTFAVTIISYFLNSLYSGMTFEDYEIYSSESNIRDFWSFSFIFGYLIFNVGISQNFESTSPLT